MSMKLMGVNRLISAARARTGVYKKGLRRGLYRGGLYLQRESQKVVPIRDNILRMSADTRIEGSGFNLACIVSYSTDYAVYVHEDLEARHKPGKQAKYLEQPLREKRTNIVRVIREGAAEDL